MPREGFLDFLDGKSFDFLRLYEPFEKVLQTLLPFDLMVCDGTSFHGYTFAKLNKIKCIFNVPG